MQQRYADSGQTLLIELQNYEQQGISIWLEGFPSSSVEVSEVMCVREDTNYMRDYVFRQGALSQGKIDMTDLSWILDALTAGRSVDQTMGDLNGDHVVDMTDAAILMDQITAAL